MTAAGQIIAVPDAEVAGAIVWWRLQGDTELQELAEAWDREDLDPDHLPRPPTPRRALARAVRSQQGPRRLARPLGGHRGWALVDESPGDEDLEYRTLLTARLDGLVLSVRGSVDVVARETVSSAYAHYTSVLTTRDVSQWLSALIQQVSAVSLRGTGGIYFVPRDQLDEWRRAAGALRAASDHQVHEIPALRSEEAVAAVLDALSREADRHLAGIEGDLDCEDLGAKALRTRAARCDRLREKVETYEQLLDRSLEQLRGRIGGLKAGVVAAALLAEAEDEDER